MLISKTKLLVLYFLSICGLVKSFNVYWNVPTQQCLRNYGHDFTSLLRAYGIIVNDEDKFQGNNIMIYYESQLGLYPRILKNGTFLNGGLPQAGNLSAHLEQVAHDIENTIKNKDFDGIGVIDWEAWRPSWKLNWQPFKIYRDESEELVKKNNPSLDDKKIEEIAISQWENGAKSYMLKTLLVAKKLRPRAKWGFYLFPDCYNYVGKKPSDFECSKSVKTENDKLSWLWKASTSIHPSIYLYSSQLNHYSLEERSWKDNEKLKEAIRVASPYTSIYPYINYFLDNEFVPLEDFRRMVAQTAAIGADGIIIWGSSSSVNSRKRCDDLKNFITQVLGPTVERVSWNSKCCSKRACYGNGLCTWPNDTRVTTWKSLLTDNVQFNAHDIVCKCKPQYTGRFCENKV